MNFTDHYLFVVHMSVRQFQQKIAQSIIGRRGFKFIKKRVTISFQGKNI